MGKPKKRASAAPTFVRKAAPSDATLEKIRAQLRIARDKVKQLADLTETSKEVSKELNTLHHETLPDMFQEVGIDQLGLPTEGNNAGCDFQLKPFYRANIAADWAPERRQEAFDYLDEEGHGDLIKTTITVFLPRDERAKAKAIEKFLISKKVEYAIDLNIPWATLTAFVKEQIEKHDAILPLDKLGAQVGNVVKMKERK